MQWRSEEVVRWIQPWFRVSWPSYCLLRLRKRDPRNLAAEVNSLKWNSKQRDIPVSTLVLLGHTLHLNVID